MLVVEAEKDWGLIELFNRRQLTHVYHTKSRHQTDGNIESNLSAGQLSCDDGLSVFKLDCWRYVVKYLIFLLVVCLQNVRCICCNGSDQDDRDKMIWSQEREGEDCLTFHPASKLEL